MGEKVMDEKKEETKEVEKEKETKREATKKQKENKTKKKETKKSEKEDKKKNEEESPKFKKSEEKPKKQEKEMEKMENNQKKKSKRKYIVLAVIIGVLLIAGLLVSTMFALINVGNEKNIDNRRQWIYRNKPHRGFKERGWCGNAKHRH